MGTWTVAYIGMVVLINWLFLVVPMVPMFGTVIPPVMLVVGFVFVFRDFAQREIGHSVILVTWNCNLYHCLNRSSGGDSMVGRVADAVVLSDEERRFLEGHVRRHKTPRSLSDRCEMILLCAEEVPSKEVAAQLGVHEHTVGKWRRRIWNAFGLQPHRSETFKRLSYDFSRLLIDKGATARHKKIIRINALNTIFVKYSFSITPILDKARGIHLRRAL
jgi:DNA-binding CsgD family transcriptional regulator